MFTPHHVSHVTYHMSHVTCHMSCVTCLDSPIFFFLFWHCGGANQLRVCYWPLLNLFFFYLRNMLSLSTKLFVAITDCHYIYYLYLQVWNQVELYLRDWGRKVQLLRPYRLNEPNGVPWTTFIWTQAKLSCLDVQSNVVCYVHLDASQIEFVGRTEQRSMLRSAGRKPNWVAWTSRTT